MPSVGRTFLVAMILLGIIGMGQVGVVIWRIEHGAPFVSQPSKSFVSGPALPLAGALKGTQARTPATPEPNPAVIEAERRLLASLPRPTPLAARRVITPEARVNDLVNLARTLRDRGDTSTALTRLREAQVISPRNWQIARSSGR